MREEWLELRKKLLFDIPVEGFRTGCENIARIYSEEYDNTCDGRRKDITAIMAELCIDIQSYLIRWHIREPGAAITVSDDVIAEQAEGIRRLLSSWGAVRELEYIKKEVDSIRKSNMMKLSILTDKGILNNRWGNDYASGLAEAMRKGAVFATTNPFIINNERKENPVRWDKVKENLKREYPCAGSGQLASIMTMQVVLKNCRELRPVFEASDGRLGYICLQVNPVNSTDSARMSEEAEFLYEQLAGELNGVPNVLFKLPGTKASLAAAGRLTQKGIGVTITVSFSVDQMEKFAEVIEKGSAKVSFVVMMSGRLDDPVRDELKNMGTDDAADAARWASTAIIRKAYDVLHVKKKFLKSIILTASLRGPWNIDGAVTDGVMPIFITSFPDKTREYDGIERQPVSRIGDDIPGEVLEKLMQSRIFRQAYIQGSMKPDDFDTFYPVIATLGSFTQSYDELVSYLEN